MKSYLMKTFIFILIFVASILGAMYLELHILFSDWHILNILLANLGISLFASVIITTSWYYLLGRD